MIADIHAAKLVNALFSLHAVVFGKFIDIAIKGAKQLLFCYTTNVVVFVKHGYIHEVIEVAEHADFAEFRYAGEHGELYAAVH